MFSYSLICYGKVVVSKWCISLFCLCFHFKPTAFWFASKTVRITTIWRYFSRRSTAHFPIDEGRDPHVIRVWGLIWTSFNRSTWWFFFGGGGGVHDTWYHWYLSHAPPLPHGEQTSTTENITFPRTRLQAVMNENCQYLFGTVCTSS